MKKTFAFILAGLLMIGSACPAFCEGAVAAESGEIVNLVDLGTVISENCYAWCGFAQADTKAEYAFDKDFGTWAVGGNELTPNGVEGGEEYWLGIKLEQPAVLSYFGYASPDYDHDGIPQRMHALHGMVVEGSNDGINWEFILDADEFDRDEYILDVQEGYNLWYTEYSYVDKAYTYFRVYNDCRGIAVWGEIEFYGVLVEPEYTLGDVNMDGEVDIHDAMLLFQNSMLPDVFTVTYPGNLDFEKDNVVDINDAIYLFQHTMMPDLYPIE